LAVRLYPNLFRDLTALPRPLAGFMEWGPVGEREGRGKEERKQQRKGLMQTLLINLLLCALCI